jgi:hypothetical protein
MSEAGNYITVLVPCRDFAKGLPRFLEGWREAFQKLGRSAQFVIVDDGGTEPSSIAVAHDLKLIRNETPKGLGSDMKVVDDDASDAILIIIPDYGYRPSDLRSILDVFKDVDMVIGVRSGQEMPKWLSISKRLGRFLRRWLFGIPAMDIMPWYGWPVARQRLRYRFTYGPRLQDPGIGLLIIRRAIFDRCEMQSQGSFAILELIAKANFLGATIAEVRLSKLGDMPIMKGRFENNPNDERTVFRRPTFLPAKNTAGTDDKSSIPTGAQ